MELYTLASGSSGNCALVTGPRGRLLIDAGISMRRIVTALKGLGIPPETLSAILVTHAHSDHIGGIKMMTKYHRIPIYCTDACADELCRAVPEAAAYINTVTPGEAFELGGLQVTAFPTSHDSPGSVGWRIAGGSSTLAYITDLGCLTRQVADAVCGADTVVLEANHDLNMLANGPYPYYLKERILSRGGHLCNDDSGRLAAWLVKNGTKRIVLAHLSHENNLPSLALAAVNRALEAEGLSAHVTVAPRSECSERVMI